MFTEKALLKSPIYWKTWKNYHLHVTHNICVSWQPYLWNRPNSGRFHRDAHIEGSQIKPSPVMAGSKNKAKSKIFRAHRPIRSERDGSPVKTETWWGRSECCREDRSYCCRLLALLPFALGENDWFRPQIEFDKFCFFIWCVGQHLQQWSPTGQNKIALFWQKYDVRARENFCCWRRY